MMESCPVKQDCWY